eukprot:GAHX01002815.1.p1 GENE.GAHX01002815.1~~GAHX01002815.1.p1  ORF type:complete len:246 (+),score=48.39 GAHX01002815.1:82-819(+)
MILHYHLLFITIIYNCHSKENFYETLIDTDSFHKTDDLFNYYIKEFKPIIGIFVELDMLQSVTSPQVEGVNDLTVFDVTILPGASYREWQFGNVNADFIILSKKYDSTFLVFEPHYGNLKTYFENNKTEKTVSLTLTLRSHSRHVNILITIDKASILEFLGIVNMLDFIGVYEAIGIIVLSFFFVATGIAIISIIILISKIFSNIKSSKKLCKEENKKKENKQIENKEEVANVNDEKSPLKEKEK